MDRILGKGRFLELLDRDGWEYCARLTGHAVVAVAAVTPAAELLLTEQFRPPVDAPVIELPAGLVGDEPGTQNEAARTAAARELEEETGYRAGRLTYLGRGPSSAGLTSEMIHFFAADRLTRIGPGGGIGNEDITVLAVALEEIGAWLSARQDAGCLVDPKVYAGLWWLSTTG